MAFRVLADLVMVAHFAFIAFVALGVFMAWRWPRVVWVHLPAVAWAVGTIVVGLNCPLTDAEKSLREWGGETAYAGGFVDRYLEDVIYPDELTPVLHVAAAVAVTVGYGRLVRLPVRRSS